MIVAISLCPVLSHILWTESIIIFLANRNTVVAKSKRNHHWLHLEDMQGLTTSSDSAQSKRALPIGQMEWFKGGSPSPKPASLPLFQKTSVEWMPIKTRERGPRSQPCREAAGRIEQVRRQWTPNCLTVVHRAQQNRKRMDVRQLQFKLCGLRSSTAQ